MRSAKTIVTTLRVAATSGAERATSDAPQASQNFWRRGLVVPQAAQTTGFTSGAAHSPQKRAPSRLSAPHAGQVTSGLPSRSGGLRTTSLPFRGVVRRMFWSEVSQSSGNGRLNAAR